MVWRAPIGTPGNWKKEEEEEELLNYQSSLFRLDFRVVNYVPQQNESILFSTFAIFGYSLNSVEKYFNLVKINIFSQY